MVKQYKHKGKKKNTVLEEAFKIALRYIDEFIPFSYNDVGLKYSRWYQRAFKAWVEQQKLNLIFKRTRLSGRGGSQDGLFYPFKLDENGKRIYAVMPTEKETEMN